VPAVWIEQTTYRLQGGCSTAELSRHIYRDSRAALPLQRSARRGIPRYIGSGLTSPQAFAHRE
jgi:hypothetical protein